MREREYVHPAPTKQPIDTRIYGGQWIAILNREIYDHDFDLDTLFERLDAAGVGEVAALQKVPKPGTIYG